MCAVVCCCVLLCAFVCVPLYVRVKFFDQIEYQQIKGKPWRRHVEYSSRDRSRYSWCRKKESVKWQIFRIDTAVIFGVLGLETFVIKTGCFNSSLSNDEIISNLSNDELTRPPRNGGSFSSRLSRLRVKWKIEKRERKLMLLYPSQL